MNGTSLAVMRAENVGLTVPGLGPFDADDVPRSADGRDWTETHVNVRDARLRFAVLELAPGLRLELFAYERPLEPIVIDEGAIRGPVICNRPHDRHS